MKIGGAGPLPIMTGRVTPAMMKMRFPESVKKGGTIGFVAPSFGCNIEPYRSAFDASLEMWSRRGYKTTLGPNCRAGDGIGISSTPENCGRELTEGYLSSESDALISCGGGELMCEILDFVDFDAIKAAAPKWYMGYSDNTNFTFTLTTMCDVASIYGPCAASFGINPLHQSLEDACGIITDDSITDDQPGRHIKFHGYGMWEKESLRDEEHPIMPYNLTEPTVLHRFIGDGRPMNPDTQETESLRMEGRLLGGCLDCLVNLCGTKYDHVSQFNKKYGQDGIIWFLEACDLNMMSIRRAMWELEHAGWFECASGFVIGRPLQFGEVMLGLDQYKAVYDIVSHQHVPILMDADIGHLSPMVPLITGSYAKVNSEGDNWSVSMYLK